MCECKKCKYAEQQVITNGLKDNYSNWICRYNGKKMIIKLSLLDSKPLTTPLWCPLGNMISLGKTEVKSSSLEQKENKSYTPYEKNEKLRKMKPMIEWDDIKENEIYHVPPLFYDDRKDIIVINKTDKSFTYKVLSKNPNTSSTLIRTMYRTMLISKFLTKHKVQDIKVVSK